MIKALATGVSLSIIILPYIDRHNYQLFQGEKYSFHYHVPSNSVYFLEKNSPYVSSVIFRQGLLVA